MSLPMWLLLFEYEVFDFFQEFLQANKKNILTHSCL